MDHSKLFSSFFLALPYDFLFEIVYYNVLLLKTVKPIHIHILLFSFFSCHAVVHGLEEFEFLSLCDCEFFLANLNFFVNFLVLLLSLFFNFRSQIVFVFLIFLNQHYLLGSLASLLDFLEHPRFLGLQQANSIGHERHIVGLLLFLCNQLVQRNFVKLCFASGRLTRIKSLVSLLRIPFRVGSRTYSNSLLCS